METYVRPADGKGGRWQISTNGGSHPRWARNAKLLFFQNESGVMAAPYEVTNSFVPRSPKLFVKYVPPGAAGSFGFDVNADGTRLLVIHRPEDSDELAPGRKLTFLFNLPDELKRRLKAGE